MADLQSAKQLVRDFNQSLDAATLGSVAAAMAPFCADDMLWRGTHPFDTRHGPAEVADTYCEPIRRAFSHIQRRELIFFAGTNELDDDTTLWVVSMGHLLGLFDAPFLGIAPTRNATFLRYAEFHRVEAGRITEAATYLDIMDFLAQSGANPLPGQTGAHVMTPGPRTQDGLLFGPQPSEEGPRTMAVMNAMLDDLTHNLKSTPQELARSWTEDMLWMGPAGIGTTYTRDRYLEQHCGPFEATLEFIRHNGHRCRIAEGHYSGFFGYPSLTMRMKGGFMGFQAHEAEADMRIVDLYRRQGDKLAEKLDLYRYAPFSDDAGHRHSRSGALTPAGGLTRARPAVRPMPAAGALEPRLRSH